MIFAYQTREETASFRHVFAPYSGFWTSNWSPIAANLVVIAANLVVIVHVVIVLVVVLVVVVVRGRRSSKKSLRLLHFESDRHEI
jgi:heme/copper-type cytochrome/quinol oxidase subunit 2